MEPQLPSPSHAPENGPAHFRGGETFPAVNQPEKKPETPEKQETREQHVGGPSGDPAAVTQAAPVLPPLPPMPATASPTAPVAADTNPATAADEDLIEKEWVEKAKKVVAETKHDPYLQGQEVSKLQADYLRKRYGKTVNLPTDGA
jgi:hypothetical protein